MSSKPDSEATFKQLKAILQPYAKSMNVVADTENHYSLDTRHIMNRKPLFFAAVRTSKSYVSYHLMPVYVEPALLDTVSPELKKRMQGKSCFNFTAIDEKLLKELTRLTKAGFAKFKELNFV